MRLYCTLHPINNNKRLRRRRRRGMCRKLLTGCKRCSIFICIEKEKERAELIIVFPRFFRPPPCIHNGTLIPLPPTANTVFIRVRNAILRTIYL